MDTENKAPGVYVLDKTPDAPSYEAESLSTLAMLGQLSLRLNPTDPSPVRLFEFTSWRSFAEVFPFDPGFADGLEWEQALPLIELPSETPALAGGGAAPAAAGGGPAAAAPAALPHAGAAAAGAPARAPAAGGGPAAAAPAAQPQAGVHTAGAPAGAPAEAPSPGGPEPGAQAGAPPASEADQPSPLSRMLRRDTSAWVERLAERAKVVPLQGTTTSQGAAPHGGTTISVPPTLFLPMPGQGQGQGSPVEVPQDVLERQLGAIAVTYLSVRGFFANGGTRLWLIDVPWDGASAFVSMGGLTSVLRTTMDVSLLAAPGHGSAVTEQIKTYCRARDPDGDKHCFGILDWRDAGANPTASNNPNDGSLGSYGPWLELPKSGGNGTVRMPPSAFVAGVIARTDSRYGTHRAPAGVEATVEGACGLEHDLDESQIGTRNTRGLNCLRMFPGQSTPVVWGTRTLAQDKHLRQIPVARLLMQIRKTLKRQTLAVVFRPNNEALRKAVHRNLYTFLEGLRRKGALEGASANEAFEVRVSRDPSDIQQGILRVEVAVRPVYAAEFVVIEVSQQLAATA